MSLRLSIIKDLPVWATTQGAEDYRRAQVSHCGGKANSTRSSNSKQHPPFIGPWLSAGALLLLLVMWVARTSATAAEPPKRADFAVQAPAHLPSSTTSNRSPTYLQDVLPIFMGKCARCHSDQAGFLDNWLDYRTAVRDRWEIKRRVWDSWQGAFFKQPMPTGNSPESQVMTEAERRTIRDWVAGGSPQGTARLSAAPLSRAECLQQGQQLFSTICAACHQPAGQGIPTRFPPLAGSDFLNADKQRAIRIVLNGLQGEVVVNGQRFNNSMPKLPLSDQEIANALTYVYSSFGNSGQEVTPQEVGAARLEKGGLLGSATPQGTTKPVEEKSPWE